MSDRQLSELLTRPYPFRTVVEPTGGWFIWFPDLPGCMAYTVTSEEVGPQARRSFELWMTAEFEAGHPFPEPTIGVNRPRWTTEDYRVPEPVVARGGTPSDGAAARR